MFDPHGKAEACALCLGVDVPWMPGVLFAPVPWNACAVPTELCLSQQGSGRDSPSFAELLCPEMLAALSSSPAALYLAHIGIHILELYKKIINILRFMAVFYTILYYAIPYQVLIYYTSILLYDFILAYVTLWPLLLCYTIHIRIYAFVRLYMYIRTCTHMRVFICMYRGIHTHRFTSTYVCTHTNVKFVRVCVCVRGGAFLMSSSV